MSDPLDDVRRSLSPERVRQTARRAVKLAEPELLPEARNLIYILAQSNRIGHFALETQVIKTLYESVYDRVVIVTGPVDAPGTNAWLPTCAGPKFRFVHTVDKDILLLGILDGGMQARPEFDLLLSGPRRTITSFYRHILDGGAVRSLSLPEAVEDRARAVLAGHGIDPDEPFVFFHNRTLKFMPGARYHEHRTADVTSYRDSIQRLNAAGYRVIRLGEPGLDTMGLDPSTYVNVPDWTEMDRTVDLFVCARCTFGLAQNSGPIWVAAAFGNQVLRTNLPFEVLNLPYRDDLSLFKHYRRIGSQARLSYREILDANLPRMTQADEITAAGYEIIPNGAGELLAATEEMLDRIAGRWQRDDARQQRFQDLSAAYAKFIEEDAELRSLGLTFYGYAHRYGAIAQSFLDANPGFLD